MSEKMSSFYEFGIHYTWQVPQSFNRKSHLPIYTFLTEIRRFFMLSSFCRRIRHIYDVRMTAKCSNLPIFVIFCTLQVTQSIAIIFIHAKWLLYKSIQHLTKFEVIPVAYNVVMTSQMSGKCRNFTILVFITLGN